jgi:hypothetical protein
LRINPPAAVTAPLPASKPPEPDVVRTATQESPTSSQPPLLASNSITLSEIPCSYPPGVDPSPRAVEVQEKEKQGKKNISGPMLDPQHLRVHKVPGENIILATEPTCLTVMKLIADVDHFRMQYEQNTPMAMFISKKVLERMFDKEATKQSTLYHSIGFVEAMASQDDKTILKLLSNAILPVNRNGHAKIIASIAQNPEYSLSDVVFNPVGYHTYTFGRVNKFLEVMLKVHRILTYYITEEDRMRLLDEGFSKEKPPVGAVNYILRAMKPLNENFTVLMKYENIKKFRSVENFIQAVKDVNGSLAKESQEIQLKKERSVPMKEQDTIFDEASRKRTNGEDVREGVSKQPAVSGKRTFYPRNSKSKGFTKGRVAMASEFNEDDEVSDGEELHAEDEDAPSLIDDDVDTDSDSNEDSDTKEQKYRRILQGSVVKDEDGNQYYPSVHVINYVNKGSAESKTKKVDTKTLPCYHMMKNPPNCPDGDKCAYSHTVATVGKRMDDDVVRITTHPIYKQYKVTQAKPASFVKKVEQLSQPTVLKQQPTIRILSAPGSAPSQSPRNYHPSTSSKSQHSQPSGNTFNSSDEGWG